MMKRLICILLVLLLFSGCGGNADPTQLEAQAPPAPTEPPGSYDPDSTVEMFTGGAVRAYPQSSSGIYAIANAGSDLILFSGTGRTTLTRLSGENLFPTAQVQLDVEIYPSDPSVQILEDQIVYYDGNTLELVWLDETFREFNRLEVPEDATGGPVLTQDGSRLYYMADSGLRVLDLETGLSRLIKQMANPTKYVDGLLLGDTVVRCTVADQDYTWTSQFVVAETGELKAVGTDSLEVATGAELYFGTVTEGNHQSLFFGRPGEQTQTVTADLLSDGMVEFLPEDNGLLSYIQRDGHWMLDYYDLVSGQRAYSVTIPETINPWYVTYDADQNRVYLLSHGAAESEIIYRWDVAASPTGDEMVYTGYRYTREAPDVAGLESCQARADSLSQRFGVDIRIWETAVQDSPWDYVLISEYEVSAIQTALDQVEAQLSAFPEGFFAQAMEALEDGALHLCLVRSLHGSAENGSLDIADGIQYWLGSDSYVAIAVGETFEKTLYHEMYHVLETRALSRSTAYYRWDELNPKGFEYDLDYVANQFRDGSPYLEEKTRSFIDTYSMSFPKEDRARIFEYACMEGNESYFISATMQKKLRTLCEGIREAYDLQESPEEFLWEQYLEMPLAYEE